ncbi:MAG: hypothetical protein ACKVH9_10450 [Rhodobacterales bacterium]|jgi:acid phosphatase family membrane protein YuiD|tara:strand:+ start:2985 stop:3218 length:234 start_codon:yes stop_codon:yes gene_type:complete
MYEKFLVYFLTHTTEFVIGALSISIMIVFVSIVFVLFDRPALRQTAGHQTIKKKKELKIKYSKEFLRRVKGIDLDLK